MDQSQANQVKQLTQRTRAAPYIVITGISLLFFAVTSPKRVPSVLLIEGFVALAALIYSLIRLSLRVSSLETRLSKGLRRGLVAVGTAFPLLLLILQSIGQLTVRDFLTLGGICLLGVLYVSHVRRR